MRATVLALIPFLTLAGVAAAAPTEPVRQCRIVWDQAQSVPAPATASPPGQCRVVHVAADERMAGTYDRPIHHVMSKAEIRAELDAIRLQVDDTQPAQPAPASKAD